MTIYSRLTFLVHLMKKPTLQREVGIVRIFNRARVITFNATQDSSTEFEGFGNLSYSVSMKYYTLTVDARYDFDEVVKYIEEYG